MSGKSTKALLTIVVPVYNEADNIRQALDSIDRDVKYPHKIMVVYDSEEDTTVPVVRALQKEQTFPGVELDLYRNKYGRGALNAIKTGLEDADTEYVIVTMADLCDPPRVINDMVEEAEAKNAVIVCGSRYMSGGSQQGGPLVKSWLSKLAGLTLCWFAGVPTHDATNSFKLYRTSFLRGEKIESSGGFELGLELVVKAYAKKLAIAEVPTSWVDRAAGESHFKVVEWLPHYLKWYFRAYKAALCRLLD
ncbi:glycosyltransferase [Selenomonas ruminantium]|uniref:glycosyltransferase n=1 Tax=Selenomonas ruminantium TaxID=971 RepID=UPI00055CA029|nr:glycosyltransferase [Selenomonas ruminantium]